MAPIFRSQPILQCPHHTIPITISKMIFCIKGPIEFDIAKCEEHKLIVEALGLTFFNDDTLKSARTQWLQAKRLHHLLREKYNKLNTKALRAIHTTAQSEGGETSHLTFDNDSSTWIATMLVDRRKNGVVVRHECTIHRAVLMNKKHHKLKESIQEQANIEYKLRAKAKIVHDIYLDRLKVMLMRKGHYLMKRDLNKYLKKSNWDLELAYACAIDHFIGT